MSTSEFLSSMQIASPCEANWADMHGDAVKRHCNLCEKFVYNISEMTEAEAVNLIQGKQDGVCVRLFKRADGTVKTSDCKTAVKAPKPWFLKFLAVFILAIFALLGGTALALGDSHYYKKLETQVRKLLGIEEPELMIMGDVECIPAPQTTKK